MGRQGILYLHRESRSGPGLRWGSVRIISPLDNSLSPPPTATGRVLITFTHGEISDLGDREMRTEVVCDVTRNIVCEDDTSVQWDHRRRIQL